MLTNREMPTRFARASNLFLYIALSCVPLRSTMAQVVPATVEGVVRLADANRPADGAVVWGDGRPQLFGPVRTDTAGRYRLETLAHGRQITVYAAAKGYQTAYGYMDIPTDGGRIERDLTLKKAFAFQGTVRGAGSPKIVHIQAETMDYSSSGTVAGTRSRAKVSVGETGEYRFTVTYDPETVAQADFYPEQQSERIHEITSAEDTANFRIRVGVAGFEPAVLENIRLVRGGIVTGVDCTLDRPAGSISGRIVDRQGKGVPKTKVSLSDVRPGLHDSAWPPVESLTDAEGRFSLRGAPSGMHGFNLMREGGGPFFRILSLSIGPFMSSGDSPFRMKPGEELKDVMITVSRGIRIRGRILRPDGSPLTNTRVRFWHEQTGLGSGRSGFTQQQTDKTGGYEFYGQSPGVFTFKVQVDGMRAIREGITVEEEGADIENVDLTLK